MASPALQTDFSKRSEPADPRLRENRRALQVFAQLRPPAVEQALMPNTSISSALAFGLFTTLTAVASGCSAFDAAGDEGAGTSLPGRENGPSGANGETPKAPPLGGPADASELTNELGVFVASSGSRTGAGTRDRPIDTIQAAIDLAKRVGKRVYVCGGTYEEAITVADSISIIGGLDCRANEWRSGGPITRIVSPSSPAMRAADIGSPTRIEGIELVAPNAGAPSQSSIGLIVANCRGLVIARSSIIAGDAAKGDDGVEGAKLAQPLSADGRNLVDAAECPNAICIPTWSLSVPGGVNVCDGVRVAESGGAGGTGGAWRVVNEISRFAFVLYAADTAPRPPIDRSGAAGADGVDGAPADVMGITLGGYAPGHGHDGTDGAPGKGGRGGSGHSPDPQVEANAPGVKGVWRGWSGASGGAGGCPGLAGSAGKGGGASIAALLVESVVTFDSVTLTSGRGGAGGLGTFGSAPTGGGNPGSDAGFAFLTHPAHGGRGGLSGVSTNGSSGPSIAIAHVGPKPTLQGTFKLVPGVGGASIPPRDRADLGIIKTIPSTPAGTSADIFGG